MAKSVLSRPHPKQTLIFPSSSTPLLYKTPSAEIYSSLSALHLQKPPRSEDADLREDLDGKDHNPRG